MVNTFSIVAHDPQGREWGVGVASRYLAVGRVVPWAKAGVGAVATQAEVNTSYGPRGLDLLAGGMKPEEVLAELTGADENRDLRQVGVIDGHGNAATYTGLQCVAWAGGRTGRNYACQGNILTGGEVIAEMARAFEEVQGPLSWRIMASLEAAEAAGGDRRGKQSAALLVAREGGGPGWFDDHPIDFRVDDHPEPVKELARILAIRMKRP